MKIAFGGDCSIIGDALAWRDQAYIEVPAYHNADKRIINLEQCISDREAVSGKTTIFAPPSVKEQISSLNADCVTLANNHVHDCGPEGIVDTLEYLDQWGLPHVGAGKNEWEASQPISIAEGIVLLAYCQYGTHYLRNVQCAKDHAPGVNGFSVEKVLRDLDSLDPETTAVVSLHWAAEYVDLPPYEIICWAKKILEHDRCCLIIGHHPHIPLGKVCHNGKEAYLSLGNFMFPNFFIDGEQRLCYPEKGAQYSTVRMLTKVPCLTHKKWQRINRQSILVTFNTDHLNVDSLSFTEQDDENPVARLASGAAARRAERRFQRLTKIYAWPSFLYRPACKLCMLFTYAVRKCKRLCFYYLGARCKESVES